MSAAAPRVAGLLAGVGLAAAPLPAAPLVAAPLPPAPRPASPLQEPDQRFHGLWSAGGVVAAQEPRAAEAGAGILRAGGNAVDAAVASSFALAVTHPQAGNLGGGGFLVLWLPGPSPAVGRGCLAAPSGTDAASGEGPEIRLGGGSAVAVNFRETAPAAATADLFLDAAGGVDRRRATRSLLSTAVPGTVAGLALVQRCYGRLPLQQVLAPAIRMAEEGVVVSRQLADSLAAGASLLLADPTSRQRFFRPLEHAGAAERPGHADGSGVRPLRPGEILRQPALAGTLRRIAARGERGFYEGPVADALVAQMERGGGLIRHRDLRGYRARLVRPLRTRFHGHPVLTMPPPGSGVTLAQLLGLLEPFDLAGSGLNSAASIHPMVEAMNLAYRDRNALLGDPDQNAIPVERLLSDAYLVELRERIDPRRHRPAAELAAEGRGDGEGTETTHLSVADRDGGLVATTTTLNFSYGNGITVPGTGVLLNNEMDDFTARPGSPNAYGLVQGRVNAIAPGRRPLSSMSPTLVFHPDGAPWLATGSPGGSRIITTVLQVLLNRIVHRLNLAGSVASPRIHSQLWPDTVRVEQGVSPDTLRLLRGLGHEVVPSRAMGAANSVEVLREGGSIGVVDGRRAEGPAVVE